MTYEKTIARHQLFFNIIIPSDWELVVSLLSTQDAAELFNICGNNNRDIVDGYIIADDVYFVAHKEGGAYETVLAGDKLGMPIANWINYTWVMGAKGPVSAVLRIVTS